MKILFILQSIGLGGSMTSMINLLSLLKKEETLGIDVLLMDPYGELYHELEKHVRILKTDYALQAVTIPREKIINKNKYGLLIGRALIWLKGKICRISTLDQGYLISAKHYSNKYDCVIAYQESIATDFAKYIDAQMHIAWVHNDYDNVLKRYRNCDNLKQVYSSYDKIVCVSKAGAKNFKNKSGINADKITTIYNTLITEKLKQKSEIDVEDILREEYKDKILNAIRSDSVKLVSSGRFVNQKRFDRVIETAVILKSKGYRFKWFILGSGELFDDISNMIINYKLQDYVYLTGGLTNPFPLIRIADAFVLSSDFEAHPMVANEALIIGKPVISTNFESASEVITDNVNGMICEMSPESMAKSLEKLFNDDQFFRLLKENAESFKYDNDSIVRDFFMLFNNGKEE